jgi:ABC-2 type transport system permease protein
MQSLSVISPLAWGQNAFQILFVRGGGLKSVLAEVAALWGFALACMGIAWWWFTRKGHNMK